MIPLEHPYIVNMLDHRDDLDNLGNFVRIAVAVEEGDIFTAEYMETLKQITDEVFYLNGVDRSGLKTLWTSNVRWVEVTEQGFQGGTVIPDATMAPGRAWSSCARTYCVRTKWAV